MPAKTPVSKSTKASKAAAKDKTKKLLGIRQARITSQQRPPVKLPRSLAPAKETPAKAVRPSVDFFSAVGRRKAAVARLWLLPRGTGQIRVNNQALDKYFSHPVYQQVVQAPLQQLGLKVDFDITVKVAGGGMQGQAEAVRQALARALLSYNEGLRKQLRLAGFLTRDARVKERKKYGLKKARRAPQWQKR